MKSIEFNREKFKKSFREGYIRLLRDYCSLKFGSDNKQTADYLNMILSKALTLKPKAKIASNIQFTYLDHDVSEYDREINEITFKIVALCNQNPAVIEESITTTPPLIYYMDRALLTAIGCKVYCPSEKKSFKSL